VGRGERAERNPKKRKPVTREMRRRRQGGPLGDLVLLVSFGLWKEKGLHREEVTEEGHSLIKNTKKNLSPGPGGRWRNEVGPPVQTAREPGKGPSHGRKGVCDKLEATPDLPAWVQGRKGTSHKTRHSSQVALLKADSNPPLLTFVKNSNSGENEPW